LVLKNNKLKKNPLLKLAVYASFLQIIIGKNQQEIGKE
jgi:hypothetical protein